MRSWSLLWPLCYDPHYTDSDQERWLQTESRVLSMISDESQLGTFIVVMMTEGDVRSVCVCYTLCHPVRLSYWILIGCWCGSSCKLMST